MNENPPSKEDWLRQYRKEQEAIRERLFPAPPRALREYRVAFDLYPSPHFGVPDGVTQLDPGPEVSNRGQPLDEIVDWELSVGPFTASLRGNRLVVHASCYNLDEAYSEVEKVVIRFLRYLTFKTGVVFNHVFRGATSSQDAMSPGEVHHYSVIYFNPESLRAAASESGRLAAKTNPDLDQSLMYYSHAMTLLKIAGEVNRGFPRSINEIERDYQSWLADVVLNLWKAQAQILGEREQRQKSIEQLRLSSDIRIGLKVIHDLRHRGGVAHTRPEDSRSKDLRIALEKGRKATEDLILAYHETLAPAHGSIVS